MMAILTEEVGEVAPDYGTSVYGEQSEKETDRDIDLGEELADVIFVTVAIANQTGVDLQLAWEQKMKIKTKRDTERHKNNYKLK